MPSNPHVVLSVDEAFADAARVAIWSLLSSATSRLNVRVIDCGLSQTSRLSLEFIVQNFRKHSIAFLSLPTQYAADPDVPAACKSAMARLFIPELLPDASRAIYLDVDILVRDDVGRLANIDLGDAPLGAVRNFRSLEKVYAARSPLQRWLKTGVEREAARECEECRAHLGVEPQDYINSGVLVFNLAAIRRNRAFSELTNYRAAARMRRIDQDWLARVFAGRMCYLDPRWNCYSSVGRSALWTFDEPERSLLVAARRNPAIVHFVGRKPWNARFRDTLRPGGKWVRAWHQTKQAVDAYLAVADLGFTKPVDDRVTPVPAEVA